MWRNHNTLEYTDLVMAASPKAAPARVFYGWRVALAFSLIVLLSSGIRFTVGPFLKPVTAELGLDRGSFSLVVSLSLFLYGAFMPLVGRLVDRVGARAVCLTIDEAGRQARRDVELERRPQPVAGGR